jgi:hypothetical protein
MKVLLVQPPFVQLNAPYPAIYYLDAFLRSRGHESMAVDHSIELYRALFCPAGLAPVFAAARASLEGPRGQGRGERGGASLDPAAAAQLERYLSYEGLYLEWIDALVSFLGRGDPALAHRLAQAVELPRGARAQAFLEAREGRIALHEARGLATAILDDLGDLVSFALDPSFGTVRYGERIAASAPSFAALRGALEASPLLSVAYAPLLDAEWRRQGTGPSLLLLSIPFPGCLLGALACARSARQAFGSGLRIALGGGYVSTELRGLRDGGIFDFCDYLCFDAGYGALDSILEVEAGAPRGRLYKTMYRDEGGRPVAAGFEAGDEAASEPARRRVQACDEGQRLRAAELEALVEVAPDYAGLDFGRYIQVADSENPMHRLWSDSPWLKYGLARGCYWRRCSFCDTGLEYVSLFAPADITSIMRAAGEASSRTGLYGLHFVDEAMPMASLLSFARENKARALAGQRPFHFWGNVRFDSSWTEDRCEYLAASGLVAVSGGIEIATEGGLEMTDKGFDLASLVKTLVAMRRAGLLVHAYLIYGFPGQSRGDIVASAEFCRQLFAAGLVDSAFWHRFVLTRHSRMYGDFLRGELAPAMAPALKPLERPWDFANNDLDFAGSAAFDEFDGPLNATLEAWMSGEGLEGGGAAGQLEAAGLPRLSRTGASGAPRSAAPAALPASVETLLARAEEELDATRPNPRGRAQWIAGLPAARPSGGGAARLAWTYRGELRELRLSKEAATAAALSLGALAGRAEGQPYQGLEAELLAILGGSREALGELRESGLVVV